MLALSRPFAGLLPPALALAVLVSAAGSALASPWDALRSGAVVLFRHASAPGVGDPPGFRLDDCKSQRNLGEAGRRQAEEIGRRFRAERVGVAAVLTSRWCRARETAERAFPRQARDETAFDSIFNESSPDPVQMQRARRIIADWRGPGTLVIVTHQVNVAALTGVSPSDGEGVVLQGGERGPVMVGRIRP